MMANSAVEDLTPLPGSELAQLWIVPGPVDSEVRLTPGGSTLGGGWRGHTRSDDQGLQIVPRSPVHAACTSFSLLLLFPPLRMPFLFYSTW